MKKRVLTAFLASCLLCTMLVGCGETTEQEIQNNDDNAEQLGEMPEGMIPGEMPEGMGEMPEGMIPGEMPEGMGEMPEGMIPGEMPQGMQQNAGMPGR
ncbi:MAG: hypothetical protein R3Y12_08385 [Clostridia bacterium]